MRSNGVPFDTRNANGTRAASRDAELRKSRDRLIRGTFFLQNQAQLVVLLFVTATVLVGPAMSKPLWSTLAGDNYLYPTAEVNAQPQYLAAYQSAHSPPYYVYNVWPNIVQYRLSCAKHNACNVRYACFQVHPSVGGAPTAVFAAGKPGVPPTFPAYSFYYGMPIYDIRIPLSAVNRGPVETSSETGRVSYKKVSAEVKASFALFQR